MEIVILMVCMVVFVFGVFYYTSTPKTNVLVDVVFLSVVTKAVISIDLVFALLMSMLGDGQWFYIAAFASSAFFLMGLFPVLKKIGEEGNLITFKSPSLIYCIMAISCISLMFGLLACVLYFLYNFVAINGFAWGIVYFAAVVIIFQFWKVVNGMSAERKHNYVPE